MFSVGSRVCRCLGRFVLHSCLLQRNMVLSVLINLARRGDKRDLAVREARKVGFEPKVLGSPPGDSAVTTPLPHEQWPSVCIYIYVYIQLHIYLCICTYICMYIYIYTYTIMIPSRGPQTEYLSAPEDLEHHHLALLTGGPRGPPVNDTRLTKIPGNPDLQATGSWAEQSRYLG